MTLATVEIDESELMTAFEAIALERIARLCKCDWEVGFTCPRCKRLGERLMQRDIDLAYCYAKLLLKHARVK